MDTLTCPRCDGPRDKDRYVLCSCCVADLRMMSSGLFAGMGLTHAVPIPLEVAEVMDVEELE